MGRNANVTSTEIAEFSLVPSFAASLAAGIYTTQL